MVGSRNSAHAWDLVALKNSFLNVKLEGFRAVDNILGQVDPRRAKWHKPVQNAILWEKMEKWKIVLDFRLFAVKSMKFSLTRFSKIQVYLYL